MSSMLGDSNYTDHPESTVRLSSSIRVTGLTSTLTFCGAGQVIGTLRQPRCLTPLPHCHACPPSPLSSPPFSPDVYPALSTCDLPHAEPESLNADYPDLADPRTPLVSRFYGLGTWVTLTHPLCRRKCHPEISAHPLLTNPVDSPAPRDYSHPTNEPPPPSTHTVPRVPLPSSTPSVQLAPALVRGQSSFQVPYDLQLTDYRPPY